MAGIVLFPHNEETYARVKDLFLTEDRVFTEQPPGTGKSFLYLKWIEDNRSDSFILFAPSLEIFAQIRGYAREAGCEYILSNVQMISYQALLQMNEDSLTALRADRIIVDEFHHLGADFWGPFTQRVIQSNPGVKVFGGTATPVRYLDSARDIGEEFFHGVAACRMTLGEAVRRGILPTPVYVPVWYDIDNLMVDYHKRVEREKDAVRQMGMMHLLERVQRSLQNSYGAEEIFKKYMPSDHGKYIVFCRGQKHIEEMVPVVSEWLRVVNPNIRYYISTSAGDKDNVQVSAFRADADDSAIRLLFVISRFDEGLHVRGIDGCIMLRPTISPAVYLQQMGRALSSGSKKPVIFDLVNNFSNVQVYSEDKGCEQNIFEYEWRSSCLSDGVEDFGIFDLELEFSTLLAELSSVFCISNEARWEHNFALLLDFYTEYNRWPRAKEVYRGELLGSWCSGQRVASKSTTYPMERKQKLLEIGFPLDCFGTAWFAKFELVKEFRALYNRWPLGKDVYKGEKLGQWVKKQRLDSKKEGYSEERRRLLESVGFPLVLETYTWDFMYALLVEYRAQTNAWPKDGVRFKGYALGNWFVSEKKRVRLGECSVEHRRMLQELGVVFDYQSQLNDMQWNTMYEALCEFYKEFSRFPERLDEYKGLKLGAWLARERVKIKKGGYPQDRVRRLSDLGVILNIYDAEWLSRLELVKEFYSDFSRWPGQKDKYRGECVGYWAWRQRNKYRNGSLESWKVDKLNEIGFEFEFPVPKEQEKTWLKKYELLREFHQVHNRWPLFTDVYKGVNLGHWVNFNRVKAKKEDYTTEHWLMLERLGLPRHA